MIRSKGFCGHLAHANRSLRQGKLLMTLLHGLSRKKKKEKKKLEIKIIRIHRHICPKVAKCETKGKKRNGHKEVTKLAVQPAGWLTGWLATF